MAITKQELEEFNHYVEERMRGGGEDLSLEDCLRHWRQEQRDRAGTAHRSAFDVLSSAGLLGCVCLAARNLSTSSEHMEGFGRSRKREKEEN